MRTAMIIFVLPALQALAELFARPELRASIELVRIRSMAALDLPVAFGAPPRDPPVQDADIVQVPGEVGAELGAVVGLNPLDRHRQAPTDLVE